MLQPRASSRSPPCRRTRPLRATAERRLRILERLTAGASVAAVACGEDVTPRRVPQLIAEAPASGEVDSAVGFVRLPIAPPGNAKQVARTKMLAANPSATGRVVPLVAERDRDRGVARAEIFAPRPPAAAAKRNGRQPLEKMESRETGACAGASL